MPRLSKPRKRDPAHLAAFHHEWLLNSYLDCYAADLTFAGELTSLAETHRDAIAALIDPAPNPEAARWLGYLTVPWLDLLVEQEAERGATEQMHNFRHVLDTFVVRWSLDLLPEPIGNTATLLGCYSLLHGDPPVLNMAVYSTHTVAALPAQVLDGAGRRGTPLAAFSGVWYPDDEPPRDAEDRLVKEFRQHVRAQIAAQQQNALKAVGRTYEPVPEYLSQHAAWLYQRVVYRTPVHDIAANGNKPESIAQETKEYAAKIGIKPIPDNKYSRRGERP